MKNLKVMGAAMAAMAALAGAPIQRSPASAPSIPYDVSRAGRRHGSGFSDANETARHYRIPKAFRQYAKRYGSDVNSLIACHSLLKNVPMLDHQRDRRQAFLRAMGVAA